MAPDLISLQSALPCIDSSSSCFSQGQGLAFIVGELSRSLGLIGRKKEAAQGKKKNHNRLCACFALDNLCICVSALQTAGPAGGVVSAKIRA